MSDENDGLLSQDDINAALAAAGLTGEVTDAGTTPPAASAPTDAGAQTADAAASASGPAIRGEAASAATAGAAAQAVPFDIPELPTHDDGAVASQAIDLLRDVELNVRIELGRTRMLVEDVLRLNEGSVVELDKLAGDPVDVLVNNRLVARGEVLVLNDNFCVRINEIVAKVDDEVMVG